MSGIDFSPLSFDMSKTAWTMLAVATFSAFTGAAATSAFFFLSEQEPKSSLAVSRMAKSRRPRRPLGSTKPIVDPTGVFQYGFPGPIIDQRTTGATTSAFDRRNRNPHWVAEQITPESLSMPNADRGRSNFMEDEEVPEQFRAKMADYFRSGYDRGHQVPAADAKWDQNAMDGTFLLTNMAPQIGEGFNRDYWARFEDFCRDLTEHFPSVRIITGPLYLPRKDPADDKWKVTYEVVGNPPNVAVPTHFYKVIFAEDGREGGDVSLGAFVMPNTPIPKSKPLADFEVPVEMVERASGLEFMSKLPVERRKQLNQVVEISFNAKDSGNKQRSLEEAPDNED